MPIRLTALPDTARLFPPFLLVVLLSLDFRPFTRLLPHNNHMEYVRLDVPKVVQAPQISSKFSRPSRILTAHVDEFIFWHAHCVDRYLL
ncbi:hypothetical protein C8R45DRAFT_1029091 [Mycena sanguinolenta]|nr:hypothetical protein C8R45DRAFT_1029091 [Mycena sanguinolenta]